MTILGAFGPMSLQSGLSLIHMCQPVKLSLGFPTAYGNYLKLIFPPPPIIPTLRKLILRSFRIVLLYFLIVLIRTSSFRWSPETETLALACS